MRTASRPVLLLALLSASLLARPLAAQVVPDSVRRDSVSRDSATGAPVPLLVRPAQDTARRPLRRAPVYQPPLSPRRAFLLSALVPGLAQSRLDRGTSGALFAGIEMAALAMLRRSVADLREVRRQRTDTVPGDFRVAPGTGAITPDGRVLPRFAEGLERSRQLHVEDWAALLVFNHLIAGADAFVAAQLWDVPTRLTLTPTAQGLALVATLRF